MSIRWSTGESLLRIKELLVRLIRGKSCSRPQQTGQDFPRGVPGLVAYDMPVAQMARTATSLPRLGHKTRTPSPRRKQKQFPAKSDRRLRANEAAGCRPALLLRQKIRVFRRNRDCFRWRVVFWTFGRPIGGMCRAGATSLRMAPDATYCSGAIYRGQITESGLSQEARSSPPSNVASMSQLLKDVNSLDQKQAMLP